MPGYEIERGHFKQKITPNADIEEVKAKATRSPLGRFMKQYKKGDFIYNIDETPFKQVVFAAVHIPTRTVFSYNPYFQTWEEMAFKFGEI